MTLVDTSVWIDHLRQNDPVLESLLEEGGVFCTRSSSASSRWGIFNHETPFCEGSEIYP